MKKYRQCNLKCDGLYTVGWIESRGAKVGALVEIENDLYRVLSVGSQEMTMDDIDRVGRAKMPSIN